MVPPVFDVPMWRKRDYIGVEASRRPLTALRWWWGGRNRTRVRKPSTVRTTCLAWLFELRLGPANRQADPRL